MDVTQAKIDDTDWRILAELQLDGRLSYKELGRRIHLSAPAVAERVRRLEDAGVIVGYGAQVDASHAGLPSWPSSSCAAGPTTASSARRLRTIARRSSPSTSWPGSSAAC